MENVCFSTENWPYFGILEMVRDTVKVTINH